MATRGGRFHGSSVWSGIRGVGFSCCLESPWDFMGKKTRWFDPKDSRKKLILVTNEHDFGWASLGFITILVDFNTTHIVNMTLLRCPWH